MLWLSGTVAWTYHVLTQYVPGVRPELDGLRIDPCIPAAWPGFTVERVYRGKRIRVRVENPHHTAIHKDGSEMYAEVAHINDGPAGAPAPPPFANREARFFREKKVIASEAEGLKVVQRVFVPQRLPLECILGVRRGAPPEVVVRD